MKRPGEGSAPRQCSGDRPLGAPRAPGFLSAVLAMVPVRYPATSPRGPNLRVDAKAMAPDRSLSV